jgi:hypothetical protein
MERVYCRGCGKFLGYAEDLRHYKMIIERHRKMLRYERP